MRFLTAACLFLLGASTAWPQRLPWQSANATTNNSTQMVRYLYPEQVTVAAGKEQTIDLHFRIAEGLHINSHTPRQKSLIRTELIAAEPAGVKITGVDFPAGSDYAFPAEPSEKLSVYSGELVLKMHFTAQRGDHLFQGALHYQACDTNTCFPPRNVPVAIDMIGR